ncbi:hypothetical protein Tco_0615222 [Tanacetum coccineum]
MLDITRRPTNVRSGGENFILVITKEYPSHTEGETKDLDKQDMDEDKLEKEQVFEEPKHAIPISSVKPTKTPELVKASSIVRPDPNALILVPYMINGKLFYLTEEQIQAHLDKEDQIRKAEEEAKRLAMTKSKVHKRQHAKNVKRLTKLNKKRVENNDKKNFDVHNPFKFADFRITELKKISEELGIQSALLTPVLEQAPSQALGRKRKHIELEPEIKPEYGIFFTNVFGDQAFQKWNDIHKVRIDSMVSYLVMALMIKTLENARFTLKLKKLIDEHPDQEKFKSKKVKLEAVRSMSEQSLSELPSGCST